MLHYHGGLRYDFDLACTTAPRRPRGRDPAESKLPALRRELERIGPVLVWYSGGVDSALLAVVAREVLGDRMACAFLDGPLIPRTAAAEARAIAARHNLPGHRDPVRPARGSGDRRETPATAATTARKPSLAC